MTITKWHWAMGIVALFSVVTVVTWTVVRGNVSASTSSGNVLLDSCQVDLEDTEDIYVKLNKKHDEEEEVLLDRLLKMTDLLAKADERASTAATELKCGKELVYQEWMTEACEKQLKGRIQECPCPKLEDTGDADDRGAAEGF